MPSDFKKPVELGQMRGIDTHGGNYSSIDQMWKKNLADRGQWYSKAISYWSKQEASVKGVLGGYTKTSAPDLRDSATFLKKLRALPNPPELGYALDCGAGIGRVTKGFLLEHFAKVDLVEPCNNLLSQAPAYINNERAVEFFCASLQDFTVPSGRYDCIWIQWVLLYLPDDDLIRFLQHCQAALREGGIICVKENVEGDGFGFVIDKEDSSITRASSHYKALFEQAGLTLVLEARQTDWPDDLFPVMLYALR